MVVLLFCGCGKIIVVVLLLDWCIVVCFVVMVFIEQSWLESQGVFCIGLLVLDVFLFDIWVWLLSWYVYWVSIDVLVYGDVLGYLLLCEVIVDYLCMMCVVCVDVSQIMIISGVQYGLQICVYVLFDLGDSVWMEEFGYFGVYQVLVIVGVCVVQVLVDDDGLDVVEGICCGLDV